MARRWAMNLHKAVKDYVEMRRRPRIQAEQGCSSVTAVCRLLATARFIGYHDPAGPSMGTKQQTGATCGVGATIDHCPLFCSSLECHRPANSDSPLGLTATSFQARTTLFVSRRGGAATPASSTSARWLARSDLLLFVRIAMRHRDAAQRGAEPTISGCRFGGRSSDCAWREVRQVPAGPNSCLDAKGLL